MHDPAASRVYKCPIILCQSFTMDDINIQMLSDHNLNDLHIDCLSGRTEQCTIYIHISPVLLSAGLIGL